MANKNDNDMHMDSALSKITPLANLQQIANDLKKEGRKVVLCHGVFDLLHLGHIRYLNSAKKFGDILIVSLTADKFVRRGPGRPVFTELHRAEALANLSAVNYVCIANFHTAIEVIETIQPNFYAKGPDYKDSSKDLTGMIDQESKAVENCGGKLVFTDDITFSSSKLINQHLDTYPADTQRFLQEFSKKHSTQSIVDQLDRAKDLKVLVIGDTIIDQYVSCSPMGKSAKENIVAQRYLGVEDFAGGVLATANHTAQLCNNIELITVLGSENSYHSFIQSRLDSNITPHFIFREGKRTTVKRRYLGEDASKKLFEVCTIDDQNLDEKEETLLISLICEKAKNADLVIVNDFGHGMINRPVMEEICKNSKVLSLNVQTNSANIGFNLITKYLRADLVCLDEAEIRLATRDKHKELELLVKRIVGFLDSKELIVTRGASGSLSYVEATDSYLSTPALADKAVDKVGAGDAFFSFASLCFALGIEPELTALVGNAAGALKLQIPGNRGPVLKADLFKFISRLLNF